MAANSQKLQMKIYQKRLRFLWILHFAITSLVMIQGIYENQGTRKYIPVVANKVSSDCSRVFINVFASNPTDPDAIICCHQNKEDDDHHLSKLCQKKSIHMSLAGRLTKFPDAWLIPLFPMILQWVYNCIQSKQIYFGWGDSSTTWMRFGFYVLVMNFRGFILFLGANELEELVTAPSPTECYYDDMLKAHQSPCYGNHFDFSDHVVLYFAQILSIPFMETLYCVGFELLSRRESGSGGTPDRRQHPRFGILHVIMVSCMLYLYIITLMGVRKTTSYFHSPSEVLVGYILSLSLQLPLAYLQCFPDGNKISKLLGFSPSVDPDD